MEPLGTEKSPIFYGYWIVAACFILLFLYAGAGFYSFSIFINPLKQEFGWGQADISFAMSIYMMFHGITAPVVGYLTEKYGPKKVMTGFALGTGASFILVSFTQSLWYFYLAYTLLSITTTGIGFVPISGLLARWFDRRRGTVTGLAMVGISAGGLVMAPVVGMINSSFSWRLSFVVLGVMVWIIALPLTLLVMKGSPGEIGLRPDGDGPKTKDTTQSADASPEHQLNGWPFKPAIRTRAFFFIVLTFFLAPLAQMGVLQHQVPLIVEIGISPIVAAAALGITAGMGGLGKLSFGWISDVLPFHWSAMLCFGLQALAIFILLNAQSMTLVWFYVVLFGFAMGGVVVLLPLAVGHFFGLASFAVIMGTIAFTQSIGSACGAYLSGLVYDLLGSYRYALIGYVCVYLTAAATIFLAGKPREYKPAQEGQSED